LDTETTGVDTEFCEVIELAMVRLEFDRADGRILAVTGRYQAFQQPSVPIPQAVTRLTGISDADAAGCSIDPAAVSRLLAGADLVLAHNAAFDRPVVERYWPGFAAKAWACSLKDVNWQAAGYEGGKLGHLILQAGGFHRGHRAMDDVDALLHLLGQPLPSSGRIGMAALVEQAGRDTVRIWADGAPYRFKDDLRARGYRWSDGKRGTPRAWYRDLNEREADEEALFLRDQMFGRDQHVFLPMRRISAVDRYSRRAERP
jgi:DNA polymerase-3 subunit epsilon